MVTLVDTSVWIEHFRNGDDKLINLLTNGDVLIHPFIIGELACGNLRNRKEILDLLQDLPQITIAQNEEVLSFIEQKSLLGKGIGWIDAHLLVSSLLDRSSLYTFDKRLHRIKDQLT